MRLIAYLAGLSAVLLSFACANSTVKSSDSLVGAESLPSSAKLAGELIQFNRRGGQRQDHLLSYELGPDNSLTVTHSVRELGMDRTLARAEFRLRSDVADRARISLSRIRPPKLRGVGDLSQPTGCPAGVGASPEADEILFIDAKERFGISMIPRQAHCNTLQARVARQLLSQILTSLPGTQVAATFPNS